MAEPSPSTPNYRRLGPETWGRVALHLIDPDARCYELGRPISASAPQSPFAAPTAVTFHATQGVAGTVHAHNGEHLAGGLCQQGTHVDALGHFGTLSRVWDGDEDFPADEITYFGGLRQAEIKPTASAGLGQLGIDDVPPIISTAVILDATRGHGGRALPPGHAIGVAELRAMLEARGGAASSPKPGGIVLIHTGWGDRWHDSDESDYYACGPGLSREAAQWLAAFEPAVVGLDNPFSDPVCPGQLRTGSPLPQGVDATAPFAVHDHYLAHMGILLIQNLVLAEPVRDGVGSGCFIALPLRIEGGSGSPIRPVLIAAPRGSIAP